MARTGPGRPVAETSTVARNPEAALVSLTRLSRSAGRAVPNTQASKYAERSRPEEAPRIHRQVERLSAPDQMGELFLAAALHSPGLQPPGFGDPS